MSESHYRTYREDGSVLSESWCLVGKYHREDGPAWIWYYPDGSVRCEAWWLNGQRHRADGPAQIVYNADGSAQVEEWRHEGKMHREDGPAFIRHTSAKELTREEWWVDGVWKKSSYAPTELRGSVRAGAPEPPVGSIVMDSGYGSWTRVKDLWFGDFGGESLGRKSWSELTKGPDAFLLLRNGGSVDD